MKARVKKTGEIIEVIQVGTKTHLYDLNNVEFIDAPEDYLTRLEHQYAGQFMQAMISSSNYIDVSEEAMADASLRIAHALVENYKKEE